MADAAYTDLLEAIIRKQASVLGMAVAVRRARSVSGLEVQDDGKVTGIPGDPVSALEHVVEQYKALSGSMGVDFCRQAAAGWSKTHPGTKLPSLLAA